MDGMQACSGCGASLSPGAAWCGKCGTTIGVGGAGSAEAQGYLEPRLRTTIPDFVRQQLHPGEQIFAAFPASLLDHRRRGEFRHDKFVLTSDRIIYYHTSVLHKGMGDMPYKMITQSKYNKGMRHGTVIVEAANAGLTIGGISNDDAAFAERIISTFVSGRTLSAGRAYVATPDKTPPPAIETPAAVGSPTSDTGMKTCPRCAEEVRAAAQICRFCRYEFPLA
jgi:hypothetical protein